MKKNKNVKRMKLSLIHFVIAIAFLSVLEPILIFFGIVKPMFTYSAGNLFFNFLRLIIIVYAGIRPCSEGLKKSFKNGALLGFIGSVILILFSFLSKTYYDKPILGISMPFSFWFIAGIVLIGNVLLWAVIAMLSGWITRKIRRI